MCRFLLNLPNAGLNTQVLHYTELDPKEREDPMAVVFPKVQNWLDSEQWII